MIDSLGDRMKRYESAYRSVLTPRMPLIIRVDGKAFHTLTRKLPAFCLPLSNVMETTMLRLCEEVQGCVLGYVQSDEISLLLHTYKRHSSSAWFDGQVQKIVSVAAGIASSEFSLASADIFGYPRRSVVFDARVFVLPEIEVMNYFLWRQQDCLRNSVQMLAHSMFSSKQCDRKNCEELKCMCATKGAPWEELDPAWQIGKTAMRYVRTVDGAFRHEWSVTLERFYNNPLLFSGLLATEDEA